MEPSLRGLIIEAKEKVEKSVGELCELYEAEIKRLEIEIERSKENVNHKKD